MPSKFPYGQLVMTTNAMETFSAAERLASLNRHLSGDWGAVATTPDGAANDQALKTGDRIFSVYKFPTAKTSVSRTLWIVTEADRSVTTLLCPEDY